MDKELKIRFTGVAEELGKNEDTISEELLAAQGSPVDLDGYYLPDVELPTRVMRASATFNAVIDAL